MLPVARGALLGSSVHVLPAEWMTISRAERQRKRVTGEISIEHGTSTHFVALNCGLVAVTMTALVGAKAGVGPHQAPARVPSMRTVGVLKEGKGSTK